MSRKRCIRSNIYMTFIIIVSVPLLENDWLINCQLIWLLLLLLLFAVNYIWNMILPASELTWLFLYKSKILEKTFLSRCQIINYLYICFPSELATTQNKWHSRSARTKKNCISRDKITIQRVRVMCAMHSCVCVCAIKISYKFYFKMTCNFLLNTFALEF